jgi:glycine cleavage system regulatory protein
MQTALVMTVIGQDRTGLVESLASLVAAHGGNWLESRMCRLGGEFAGILRVHVPSDRRAALQESLSTLPGLNVVVRSDDAAPAAEEPRLVSLEVIGQDRPGIVREITGVLAALGVNMEELATECTSAPMSGELLFTAQAILQLPPDLTVPVLCEALEKAGADLNVQIAPINS